MDERSDGGWRWIREEAGERLLALLVGADRTAPRTIERARRLADPETVRAALSLLDARERARGKLARAEALLLDRVGVEQSTSTDVARYKARRLLAGHTGQVLDLCCGIGGDALGLALEGGTPILVDRDIARATAARWNVRAVGAPLPPAVIADLAAGAIPPTPGGPSSRAVGPLPFHLDPDRRPDGRRSWSSRDLLPGPPVIGAWIRSGRAGAVKLGPGAELEHLPELFEVDGARIPLEIEVIQRGRGLVQTVLWCGPPASAPRRATRVDGARVTSLEGPAGDPPLAEITDGDPRIEAGGVYLHLVEPAVERADLLGVLARIHGLTLPHDHCGLLAGDRPIVGPWLRPLRLLGVLAGRVQDVRRWTKERGMRVTAVRARGGEEPALWKRKLGGGGADGTAVALHLTREGKRIRAWITEEIPPPPDHGGDSAP